MASNAAQWTSAILTGTAVLVTVGVQTLDTLRRRSTRKLEQRRIMRSVKVRTSPDSKWLKNDAEGSQLMYRLGGGIENRSGQTLYNVRINLRYKETDQYEPEPESLFEGDRATATIEYVLPVPDSQQFAYEGVRSFGWVIPNENAPTGGFATQDTPAMSVRVLVKDEYGYTWLLLPGREPRRVFWWQRNELLTKHDAWL